MASCPVVSTQTRRVPSHSAYLLSVPVAHVNPAVGYLVHTYSGRGGSFVDTYGEEIVSTLRTSSTAAFKTAAALVGLTSVFPLKPVQYAVSNVLVLTFPPFSSAFTATPK